MVEMEMEDGWRLRSEMKVGASVEESKMAANFPFLLSMQHFTPQNEE